jgi:hypothetical protein
MRFISIKRMSMFFSLAFVMSMFTVGTVQAAETTPSSTGGASCTGTDCLPPILQNTTGILSAVSNIPKYLQKMVEFALNWEAKDDSTYTSQMQAYFDTLGKNVSQNNQAQLSAQQQLIATIVNQPLTSFSPASNSPKPAILGPLPNINDLAYSSMLGFPPVTKNAPAYNPINFVNYAGGAGLPHALPTAPAGGAGINASPYLLTYQAYYNTVVSIESFNGFVLSGLAADSANGPKSNTNIQNTLIAQASNSNWIANIASEELGKVLRQILVFQSQTYVLMTQLLQTQKQLLTASVMTNTLLIANNRTNECVMAAKAQGISAANC